MAATFSVSDGLFNIDELFYVLMADAASNGGSLVIENGFDLFPSDLLKVLLLREGPSGLAPQYPSGYAFLAVPFFLLLGIRGLIVLNAVAFLGALTATYALARWMDAPKRTAFAAVLILALATFGMEYAFAIWPHALSMAIVCASILAVVASTRTAGGARAALALALLGGLAAGFGTTVRVDVVLAVPPVLLWLATHRTRWPNAVAYGVGLLPGLVLAAWLNHLKFGVWLPISYGMTVGSTALSAYWPLLPVGVIVGLAALALSSARVRELCLTRSALVLAAVLVVALLAVDESRMLILKVLSGAYVLIVDLQAYEPWRLETAVRPGETGHLLFYGVVKRALLQSLPYLGLAPVLLVLFREKRQAGPVSLLCLTIVLWITPFAFRHWHGGFAFNMRYFLPLLPLIAVLTALCLAEVASAAKPFGERGVAWLGCIAVLAGIGVLFIFLETLLGNAMGRDLALYGSLALAGMLSVASLPVALAGGRLKQRAARAALVLSTVCLVWAGVSAFAHDFVLGQIQRWRVAAVNEAAEQLEEGALVITRSPHRFLPQFRRPESFVAMIFGEIDPKERALIDYHLRAGRKVYVHGWALADDLLAAFGEPAYGTSEVTKGDVVFVQLLRPDGGD